MRCTYGEMDWFCHREAGHAGPHESEPLRPDVAADSPLRASGLSDGPEMLMPPKRTGMRVGSEGRPIPAPTYLVDGATGLEDHLELFGESARVVVINGCLCDVRQAEPGATSYRVAEWVDAYLRYYDKLLAALPTEQEPANG